MKLQNLKVGDQVRHYVAGKIVSATVIAVGNNQVTTEHASVRWGKEEYVKSIIYRSSELQYSTSQTTPGAWYKGRKLQA